MEGSQVGFMRGGAPKRPSLNQLVPQPPCPIGGGAPWGVGGARTLTVPLFPPIYLSK